MMIADQTNLRAGQNKAAGKFFAELIIIACAAIDCDSGGSFGLFHGPIISQIW